jgi:4-amino-4-deoxychorismate lyase
LINGQEQSQISILDRGLLYGDGLFETIWVHQGKAFYFADHLHRLQNGCERLAIPAPSSETLLTEIEQLCSDQQGILKIIITRGIGERGYRSPEKINCSRIVSFFPENQPQIANHKLSIIKARICKTRLSQQINLAGIKHLNRLENVMARSEWQTADIMEGIMLDTDEQVISGTMTNLFLIKEGILYTPEIKTSGIKGIAREQILRYCDNHRIPCYETKITLKQLLNADEFFFCNSIQGFWAVKEIEGHDKQFSTEFIQHYLKQALIFC